MVPAMAGFAGVRGKVRGWTVFARLPVLRCLPGMCRCLAVGMTVSPGRLWGVPVTGMPEWYRMQRRGRRCLVLERRAFPGGNIRSEEREGIHVHVYGAHIFHTNSKEVWQYVNQFADFNQFVNAPIANFRGELYHLPFNMNTFHAMWGVTTPAQAAAKIASQRAGITGEPRNLEEQAISLVGRDIYEKLIQGYTEKQWGRKCTELPAFIIKRLPVRYTYDNNYFQARYQGIPVGGYNRIIDGLLDGVLGLA